MKIAWKLKKKIIIIIILKINNKNINGNINIYAKLEGYLNCENKTFIEVSSNNKEINNQKYVNLNNSKNNEYIYSSKPPYHF